ncbi:transposase [Streptomyces flaveolus]|uniref:transposase n=1 Tax=Streptomyces flaveolus TaxID=67297 RepID=UPI003F568A9D
MAKRGIGSQNSRSSPENMPVRARVEHVFARMRTWKILRDCRHRSDGVQHAMRGIARLHNLNLAG